MVGLETAGRFSDGRAIFGLSEHLFADLHRNVVLLCDEIQTRPSLQQDLRARHPEEVAGGTLDRVIDELLQADVFMAEGIQLLTLPIGRRPRTTEELRANVLGDAGIAEVAGERRRLLVLASA